MFILFYIATFSINSYGISQCSLSIYPTRIVIEKNEKKSELIASNKGVEICTFKAKVMDIKTFENGTFALDSDNVPFSAKEMLRISPKVFTLGPNEKQTIRVKVKKPFGISNGEYRSHISLSSISSRALQKKNKKEQTLKPSSVELGNIPININLSFPVLVRFGKSESNVLIEKIALEKDEKENMPVLDIALRRTGNKSTYGFLDIKYQNKKGEIIPIERTGVFAIYRSTDIQKRKIQLKNLKELEKNKGKLIVKYIKARTKPDRDNIEKFETSSHYKLLDKKEIDI